MLLWTALFLIFALLTACTSSSDDLSFGEVVKGDVGRNLDTYLTRITPFGFSGALLVAKEGEILLNKGYGWAIRSDNIPNTEDTVFSTGSITKQFTAAGIMKLEMMGKLKTSDLISRYFDNVAEDKKGITLHHLLTHTSGVVDGVGRDYEKALRDETVRRVLDEPLLFEPGERFSYSNAGYSLLAAVIEKVSGRTYEEFLHDNLFKPAGMNFTGYRLPDWSKKVVAHWYRGERDNGTPLEKPYPYWNLLGNGGILSTTTDMYKWHLALLGNRVLSDEAKTKIFTPYLNDYGYGWDVLQREMGTLIQHDGASTLGNSAEIRRYIDAGVVTILFCNQSFERGPLFEAVRDKIEELAFGQEVAFPQAVTIPDLAMLKMYEGTYMLPGGGAFHVRRQGNVLRVRPEGQDAVDAMFNVKKADAATYSKLSRLSEIVFISALSGNFDEFGKVLDDRDRMLSFFREHIPMRLERNKKRTGEIKGVFSRAVIPIEPKGESPVQVYVELKGEKGSVFFGLIWRDSKIVGLEAVRGVPDLSIPFLPLKAEGSDFIGYHLDMARNFQISFRKDERGKITGLTVGTEGGLIRAAR